MGIPRTGVRQTSRPTCTTAGDAALGAGTRTRRDGAWGACVNSGRAGVISQTVTTFRPTVARPTWEPIPTVVGAVGRRATRRRPTTSRAYATTLGGGIGSAPRHAWMDSSTATAIQGMDVRQTSGRVRIVARVERRARCPSRAAVGRVWQWRAGSKRTARRAMSARRRRRTSPTVVRVARVACRRMARGWCATSGRASRCVRVPWRTATASLPMGARWIPGPTR